MGSIELNLDTGKFSAKNPINESTEVDKIQNIHKYYMNIIYEIKWIHRI